MKSLFCSALFLLTFSQNAQSPTAVPVRDEPHHHLVLENSYVRVFRVSIPANDATLLHQHDSPYLFVALGPADFTNAVAGKPEVEAKLADGQVGYSRGGFAHIARTDHGIPFNNVTVELLHPQNDPHNICAEVLPNSPAQPCQVTVPGKEPGSIVEHLFQTAEIEVDQVRLAPGTKQSQFGPNSGTLVVVLNGSQVGVAVSGKSEETLEGGQTIWLNLGSHPTISNAGKNVSSFLLLNFKDEGPATKP